MKTKETQPIRDLVHLYPSTQPYVISAVIIAALGGLIGIRTALILLAIAAVLAVLIADRVDVRQNLMEVRQMHRMIDGQHTALVARIDALTKILTDMGVQPPPESAKVHEARLEEHPL